MTPAEALGFVFEAGVAAGLVVAWTRDGVPVDRAGAPAVGRPLTEVEGWFDAVLGASDPDSLVRAQRRAAVRHVAGISHRTGQTLGRAILAEVRRRAGTERLRLARLWAPDPLGAPRAHDPALADDFLRGWDLPPTIPVEQLTNKGRPARSDVLAWLEADGERTSHHLVAVEASYRALVAPGDRPDPDLDPRLLLPDCRQARQQRYEMKRVAEYLRSRSVFATIQAETLGTRPFDVDPRLARFLVGFHRSDRPAYKLAQACAYATSARRLLAEHDRFPDGPPTLYAVAATNVGLAGVSAAPEARSHEVRYGVMDDLGTCYLDAERPGDDPSEVMRDVHARILRLQSADPFSEHLISAVLAADAERPRTLDIEIEEAPPFTPVTRPFPLTAVRAWSDEPPPSGSPAPRSWAAVCARLDTTKPITIRSVHAAAIEEVLRTAPVGELTTLMLCGAPGIGKTTAIRETLLRSGSQGFLHLFLSPRINVNETVFGEFSKAGEKVMERATLCLTTSSDLLGGFRQQKAREGGRRGCVHFDGVAGPLTFNASAPRFLDRNAVAEIQRTAGTRHRRGRPLGERATEIESVHDNGVVKTLVAAMRAAVESGRFPRLMATCAIQAQQRIGARTTFGHLQHLLPEPGTEEGRRARTELAARCPTIVVMVDELAGDGAGASCVWALHEQLDAIFLRPYRDQGEPSPFHVVLVVSDASLGDPVAMRAFLASGNDQTRKVLLLPTRDAPPVRMEEVEEIAPARGDWRPIRGAVAVTANAFPAETLRLRHRVLLRSLDEGEKVRQRDAAVLLGEVRAALGRVEAAHRQMPGRPRGQVLAFVQDRGMIQELRAALLDDPDGAVALQPNEIETLSSTVGGTARERLRDPSHRDRLRVILMTSSGSRGIDIPLATELVAFVPRFEIEAQFMEIVQFAYRGRGRARIGAKVVECDGLPRRLSLVLSAPLPPRLLAADQGRRLSAAVDLGTAVALLRGALLTRITGGASLRARRVAVIPLGRTGMHDVAELLQQDVDRFLREAGSVFAEGASEDVIARVQKARQLIHEVFRVVESIVHPSADGVGASFVHNYGLLPSGQDRPLADAFPALGEAETVWGPWVLGVVHRLEERLQQRLSDGTYREQRAQLCGLLRGISDALERHRLGRAARDLLDLLSKVPDRDRDHDLVHWHEAMAAFCYVLPQSAALSVCGDADDQERWHANLVGGTQALLGSCECFPLAGAYNDVPFMLARRSPHEIQRECGVFREGLYVSRDLNLVNALLLTETWDGGATAAEAGSAP